MRKLVALLKNDLRNIMRELMLIYIMVLPFLLGLGILYFIPILRDSLLDRFDLIKYYPLITGYLLILVPVLLGMVTGFLLLDERDERVMYALIVTPLSKQGYIYYRIFTPMLISFCYTIILLLVTGLVKVKLILLLPLALLGSLVAPIVALFLATLAGNKVEGLALSKGLGLLMLAPLIRFVEVKWSFLAGVVPFYWPVQAFVFASQNNIIDYLFYLLIGLIINLVILIFLSNKLNKKI